MKPLEVLNGSTKRELASEFTRALLPLLHIVQKALGRKDNVTFAQGKQALDDAMQVIEGLGEKISLADYVEVYHPDVLEYYKAWSGAEWGLTPGDQVEIGRNRYEFIEHRSPTNDIPGSHYVFGIDGLAALSVRSEILHTSVKPVSK